MKSIYNFIRTPNFWFKSTLILIIVLIFPKGYVLSQSTAKVIVSGAGTVAVNGTYTYTGMANSRPYFTFGIYRVEYRNGGYGLEWEIWDTNETNPSYEVKYYNASIINTPPTSTWSIDVASPPAPSVSYIDIPIISTNAASSITFSSAILGGNITSDGGSPVTERGVVYSSTNTNPAIGGVDVTQIANGSGTGSYNISINSLANATKYYVKAYATNTAGTAYGNIVSFTTIDVTSLYNLTGEPIIITPNPATNGFYINAGSKRILLVVLDLNGRALVTQFVKGKSYINISNLASGLYLVKVGEQKIKLLKK